MIPAVTAYAVHPDEMMTRAISAISLSLPVSTLPFFSGEANSR